MATKTYKLKTPDGRTYATSDEAERDQLVRTRGYADVTPKPRKADPQRKAAQRPANKAAQAPADKAEAPATETKAD